MKLITLGSERVNESQVIAQNYKFKVSFHSLSSAVPLETWPRNSTLRFDIN